MQEQERAERKLQFFLKYTQNGFALLTVNEWRIAEKIIKYVEDETRPEIYTVTGENYAEILNSLDKKKTVLFLEMDLSEKDMYILLEKVNLGRDLLLKKSGCCIFIVPLYAERYIQESLPNLYDYFQFKERYIREYQSYFEYILPDAEYQKTKVMQRILKKNLQNADNIVQKLEGYQHVLVTEEQFDSLQSEVYKYVKEVWNNTQIQTEKSKEKEEAFCWRLLLTLARVAITQGNYKKAQNIYKDMICSIEARGRKLSQNEKLEIWKGLSDAELYQKEYDEAYKGYARILELYQSDYNENRQEYEEFLLTKIRIYSKLALCEWKRGNEKTALKYIETSIRQAKEVSKEQKKELFAVYYNYFLMNLEITPKCSRMGDALYQILDGLEKNEVQEAMFLTVAAWYQGILKGDLVYASKAADRALQIKRRLYIENDARIAESHYVNAMIRMFQGKYDEAEHCCVKSMNILKNFTSHMGQKEKSRQLMKTVRQWKTEK